MVWLPVLVVFSGAFVALLGHTKVLGKTLGTDRLSKILALFPFAALIWLIWQFPLLGAGQAISWQINWISATDLQISFFYDSLSAIFALLVTGIGTLVVIYSGYYFKNDRQGWKFLSYLFLFMFAMLGLILAGNLITLFIFWEITSITSFLLISYKSSSEKARQGAFKALLITGSGGVALLLGAVLISSITGSTEFNILLSNGDMIRTSNLYPTILALIALAAFTKSAQTPFHIWLPDAMSAPTPASAYLHSATMVKAGIYLIARLNPILGQTEAWFWVFSSIGLATMLTGAYLGLKQNDLKALLAYSTISQLGVMVLLIGQDTDIAFKALVISVIAHGLYKSALFLVAGIVDHETGTRDLRQLGGLRRKMPFSMGIAALAGLSMAGLPPMFGFLAKETLLASAVHPSLPKALSIVFPAAVVIAGALVLAQAGLFVWDTFLGKRRNSSIQPHEAPWGMLLAPLIPATLSILFSVLPEPEPLATFLASAAGVAFGGDVKVSLTLWAGLTVPFLLSVFAVTIGLFIFVFRNPVRMFQAKIAPNVTINAFYTFSLWMVDIAGNLVTRMQGGKLRNYLSVMLVSLVVLVVIFTGIPEIDTSLFNWQTVSNIGFAIAILRIFALFVIIGAALASIFIRRDFSAILTLGAMGLSIAVLMVLEPDPDVALVQMIVDLLAVVILVLALTRLPRVQRERARELTYKQSRISLIRDVLISVVLGGLVAWITLIALITRPRESALTPFFEANAKLMTGAKDIVGAIVVDFRAFDTLIEIAVFSIAGLGIYTLLLYASRMAGDNVQDEPMTTINILQTTGIGGPHTSSFVHALAYTSLPFSMILAVIHMMYGHDQPGDGFTAGVIVGLVVAFWYVVFGYTEVKARLRWLRPMPLIASGILLAIFNGILAAVIRGNFLSNVDYGSMLGIPLPSGFNLSTSFIFEVAIFLAILGSISYMLSGLGHPRISDTKSYKDIESLDK